MLLVSPVNIDLILNRQ